MKKSDWRLEEYCDKSVRINHNYPVNSKIIYMLWAGIDNTEFINNKLHCEYHSNLIYNIIHDVKLQVFEDFEYWGDNGLDIFFTISAAIRFLTHLTEWNMPPDNPNTEVLIKFKYSLINKYIF